MPDRPTSNPKQYIQGCPVLHVPDVMAMADYFRDVLGFHCDFGDANYAVVWRDNSAVHFEHGTSDPTGVHLFQWIHDVDACHAEVTARGAEIVAAPADRAYGLRDFAVMAPGKLTIVFGQEIR
jgi:catechol 2,3-dioxygenase-like lactoylglutathione lyase family enzyme